MEEVPKRPLIVAAAIVASVIVVMATLPLWSGVVREDGARAARGEARWSTSDAEIIAAEVIEATGAAWRAARTWAENGF